jgi:hypothetical protein
MILCALRTRDTPGNREARAQWIFARGRLQAGLVALAVDERTQPGAALNCPQIAARHEPVGQDAMAVLGEH